MVAQKLECGIEIAVVGRHHQIERGIGEAVAAVAAVTKILDAFGHDAEVARSHLEWAAARRLSPMCHCLVAAARWAAIVQPELGYPAIKPRQSEVVKVPVWCVSIGVEVGAPITQPAR